MEKPRWLDDETEIANLLHRFLDNLDKTPASQRKKPPEIKLRNTDFPILARQDDDADRQWVLINTLADQGLFELRAPRKRNPFDPVHENIRLLLQPGAEDVLRRWLQLCRYPPAARTAAMGTVRGSRAFILNTSAPEIRRLQMTAKNRIDRPIGRLTTFSPPGREGWGDTIKLHAMSF